MGKYIILQKIELIFSTESHISKEASHLLQIFFDQQFETLPEGCDGRGARDRRHDPHRLVGHALDLRSQLCELLHLRILSYQSGK